MVAEMLQKEFLCDIKLYFYAIKINLYSIKYIYMTSKYIFIQTNKFVFKKKYFCYTTFFRPIKIFYYYMNFSFDTFPMTVSGPSFLFAKVRILLSVYKSAML